MRASRACNRCMRKQHVSSSIMMVLFGALVLSALSGLHAHVHKLHMRAFPSSTPPSSNQGPLSVATPCLRHCCGFVSRACPRVLVIMIRMMHGQRRTLAAAASKLKQGLHRAPCTPTTIFAPSAPISFFLQSTSAQLPQHSFSFQNQSVSFQIKSTAPFTPPAPQPEKYFPGSGKGPPLDLDTKQ